MRIDTFCKENGGYPNVVKIDIEGCSLEVLTSFGEYISGVDIFHIESEKIQYFKDQHLGRL